MLDLSYKYVIAAVYYETTVMVSDIETYVAEYIKKGKDMNKLTIPRYLNVFKDLNLPNIFKNFIKYYNIVLQDFYDNVCRLYSNYDSTASFEELHQELIKLGIFVNANENLTSANNQTEESPAGNILPPEYIQKYSHKIIAITSIENPLRTILNNLIKFHDYFR